jgi:hypothetical protein
MLAGPILSAEGEPIRGKVAVAIVIRNRMTLRYSSDGTVAGQSFGASSSRPGTTINRTTSPDHPAAAMRTT